MAIIKKTVIGTTSGAVIPLPKEYSDKNVWVVSEDDIDELTELIQMTLLYRKAYKHDQSEFLTEFKEFRKDIETRIKRLESIIIVH